MTSRGSIGRREEGVRPTKSHHLMVQWDTEYSEYLTDVYSKWTMEKQPIWDTERQDSSNHLTKSQINPTSKKLISSNKHFSIGFMFKKLS